MYNNGFQVTSENTLREFPLVIATVAKVSRKRGLWLVVRVNKQDCPAKPSAAGGSSYRGNIWISGNSNLRYRMNSSHEDIFNAEKAHSVCHC